ncbi:MAG: UvrD-helicase domain-containing protein [Clostridia bacterium]|nr:UvrD-helicase domain-containing protein [Clostridia bacterium]
MTEQEKSRFLKAKRALFDKYYSFLNEKQREAVYTVKGPVLILAGAGSGKTTVLTNRIAHIIKYGNAYFSNDVPDFMTADSVEDLENAINLTNEEIEKYLELFSKDACPAWNILAITFTNKAANEIKARLARILDEDASDIWSGTFHSVCVRILRSYGTLIGYRPAFGICDTDDAKKLISKCMKDLNIDEKRLSIKAVMNEIGRAKDRLQDPQDYASEVGNDAKYKDVARVYELYQKRLMDSNLLDFDDIIMKTVQLFRENSDVLAHYQNKFKYVLVDEYQDTNKAQFVLVSLLGDFYKNVMVVGDDDQSIYKFRGATIENILNFDAKYLDATVVKLEQNYRSTSNILNAANCVISNNPHKHQKELWCQNEEGDKILVKETYTQNDESRFIIDKIIELRNDRNLEYKDFAILYRMNAQSMNLETMFAKSGIPYRMLGALRFYDRKEVKDMIAYLSIINNPSDNVRLRRIVNEPKRKIGDASFDTASKIAEELGVPTLEILEKATDYLAIPKIAANAMVAFAKTINSLREDAEFIPLSGLVREVMKRTGYEASIVALGQAEAERLENLDALCVAIKEYEERDEDPSLSGFLEEVTLVSDVDRYDENADAVTLMTIHSAKGLEFPVVFLPGMEEGVFPGQQSMAMPSEIEEERRLAYVAITRAKKTLIITHARERMLYGMTQRNPLSRFVREIDEEYLDIKKERQLSYSGFETTSRPKPQNIMGLFTANNQATKKPERKLEEVYSVGDRIKHMTFGEGTVLNVTPMSSDFMYEIAFDNVGTKKLLATYVAKLMKKI